MAAPVVTFSYAAWIAMFPEFRSCTPPQGQAFFSRACLMFANDVCNPAYSAGNMAGLLYLLTSHVAWLNAPRDADGNPASCGAPAPSIVGRISSASEGSVSVQAEWTGSGSPSEAYYLQTRYGAEFWNATAVFRTGNYLARPTFVPTAIFPGRFGFGRRF